MADKSRGFYIYTNDNVKVKNLKINLLPIRTAENDVRAYKSLRIRMGDDGEWYIYSYPLNYCYGKLFEMDRQTVTVDVPFVGVSDSSYFRSQKNVLHSYCPASVAYMDWYHFFECVIPKGEAYQTDYSKNISHALRITRLPPLHHLEECIDEPITRKQRSNLYWNYLKYKLKGGK